MEKHHRDSSSSSHLKKWASIDRRIWDFMHSLWKSFFLFTRCLGPGPASRSRLCKVPKSPSCTCKQGISCFLMAQIAHTCQKKKIKNHRMKPCGKISAFYCRNRNITPKKGSPFSGKSSLFFTGRASAYLLCLAGYHIAKPTATGSEENKNSLGKQWKKTEWTLQLGKKKDRGEHNELQMHRGLPYCNGRRYLISMLMMD